MRILQNILTLSLSKGEEWWPKATKPSSERFRTTNAASQSERPEETGP
jgi:hypothetical protein